MLANKMGKNAYGKYDRQKAGRGNRKTSFRVDKRVGFASYEYESASLRSSTRTLPYRFVRAENARSTFEEIVGRSVRYVDVDVDAVVSPPNTISR